MQEVVNALLLVALVPVARLLIECHKVVVGDDASSVLSKRKDQLVFDDLATHLGPLQLLSFRYELLLDLLCLSHVVDCPLVLLHALRSNYRTQDHVARASPTLVVLPSEHVYSLVQIVERLIAELVLDSCMRDEEHLRLLVETLVQVVGLLVLLDVPFEEIHLQAHVPILASLVLASPLLPLLQLAYVGDVDVESLCQLDDRPGHLPSNQLDIHDADDDVAEVSEYEVRKPERKDVRVKRHFWDDDIAP